jgi:hypothetical protein
MPPTQPMRFSEFGTPPARPAAETAAPQISNRLHSVVHASRVPGGGLELDSIQLIFRYLASWVSSDAI